MPFTMFRPIWGGVRQAPRKQVTRGSRRVAVRRSMDYLTIKAEVLEAVARLARSLQAIIPATGTLPEIMVGLALVKIPLPCQAQQDEQGGRLRLGGSIIDWKVWLGGEAVIVRVQGDYWHSTKEVRMRDEMQLQRLRSMGYRVADIWEHELYEAWVENRLVPFVREKVMSAT